MFENLIMAGVNEAKGLAGPGYFLRASEDLVELASHAQASGKPGKAAEIRELADRVSRVAEQ